MHCVVYVLRRAGEKLPTDVVKSRPNVGWFYWGPDSRKFYPGEACRLFTKRGVEVDVIEPLVSPHMKKIDGGMLIRGREEIRSSATDPQTWWVLPGPLDDLTAPPDSQ